MQKLCGEKSDLSLQMQRWRPKVSYNQYVPFNLTTFLFFSLTSVWTVPDLVHAVSNGDKVVQIFEVLAYRDFSNYLKKFLDILSSFKLRHSSFSSNNHDELKEICEQINQEMNFTMPELMLTPEILEENSQLKEFFKLWSNALLGKEA